MQQRVHDRLRDFRANERTGARARIERGLDAASMRLVTFARARERDGLRKQIGGPKRDELRSFGHIEVRQTTRDMPTSMLARHGYCEDERSGGAPAADAPRKNRRRGRRRSNMREKLTTSNSMIAASLRISVISRSGLERD